MTTDSTVLQFGYPIKKKGNMADFLHAREYLEAGDTIEVTVDCQCNVIVMDDYNFSNYKRQSSFNHFGGWVTSSSIRIKVDRDTYWNTVIDLGGRAGTIRHSIRYIKHP